MVQDPKLAEHQRLQEMLMQLDALGDRINRLSPLPASDAHRDLHAPEPKRQLAWQHGTVALVVAADNMNGLRTIASAYPRPVFALMPPLRTAVDGASLARGLFDPRADSDEKMRRAIRAEEEDLIELDKAQVAGKGGTYIRLPLAPAAPRLKTLRETIRKRKLPEASHSEFASSKLASRYASFPDGGPDSGGWLYATLSAVVHSRRWALGLADSRSDDPFDPLTAVTSRPNLKLALRLTAVVLDHLIVAIQDAERYAGFGEPTK
jgi:hypothetical protein